MAWAGGNRYFRQKITISGANVAGDVTDFPVAVNILAGNDVFTEADTSGADIFFTADDEVTVLDFERSVWDKSGEEGVFYVKTDLLSASDNEIYIYYGGDNLTDYEDAENTWDDNFYSVYHFEETSGNLLDSTSNSRDGTVSGPLRSQISPLGDSYYFDGSNDYVQIYTTDSNPNRLPGDDTHTYGELTVAIYCRPGTGNDRGIFSVSDATFGDGGNDRHIYFDSAGNVRHRLWPVETLDTADTDWSDNQWHQIAIAYGQGSGKNHKIVIDGQTRVTGSASVQSEFDWNERHYIGFAGDAANDYYNGYITEVRISRIYRAVEWLETEYNNILDSVNFLNFASREVNPFLITTSPYDHPTVVEVAEFQPFGAYRQMTTAYTGGTASTIYYDIPVDVALVDTVSGTSDLDVDLILASSGTFTPSFFNIDTDFEISSSGFFLDGLIKYRNDFDIGFLVPGEYLARDVDVAFFQGFLDIEHQKEVDVDFFLGFITDVEEDLDVDFNIANTNLVSGNLTENYLIDVYSSTYSGTVVAAPWYDGAWSYRQKITIDYTKVVTNHTDFPVAIRIFGSNEVFTKAQGSGNDILFTDSLHNKLSHELSRFEVGNEELLAYVKTDLSSSVNTVLYMYYGKSGAPDQSDMDNAWATHYDGVYHFEESSGSLLDSSGNSRDSDVESGITRDQPGLLGGKSWAFDSSDYVQINQSKGLVITGNAARTVTAYMYPTVNEGGQNAWASLILLGDGSGLRGWMLSVDNSGECSPSQSIGIHYWGTNTCTGKTLTNIGINQWHQYAGTHNGSNAQRVFLNGNFEGSSSYTLNTNNGNAYIGRRVPQSSSAFRGRIGEIRVSSSNLGDAWIETEYNNMLDNANFFSLDSEEEYEAPYWELDDYINVDTTVSGGSIRPLLTDVFSSVSGTQFNFVSDLYVSLCNTVPSGQVYKSPAVWPVGSGYYMESEATVSGGSLTGYDQDVYVSLEAMTTASGGGVNSDIRLHAMEILNFFLDVDEYATSASTMYVDIIDKRRIPISTANSYFTVSGTQVPVTFSGIEIPMTDLGTPIVASGYRMFYDPAPDFISDEPIEIVAHAENIVDDKLEETYYLLYGYNLVFDTPPSVEWPWGDDVVVWATATNKATCPTTSADGWIFSTVPRQHADLGATINPIGGEGLLPAVIYPQLRPNTFFYGANVKVVIKAKDLAGNEMEPFTLDFTIEDKPN